MSSCRLTRYLFLPRLLCLPFYVLIFGFALFRRPEPAHKFFLLIWRSQSAINVAVAAQDGGLPSLATLEFADNRYPRYARDSA